MKKVVILFISMIFFNSAIISACVLDANLINQDPYPAIPGEYVKLIFQITGVNDPTCGKVWFEIIDNYPLIFDPGVSNRFEINSGTYQREFSSYFIAPYKVRVDKDALDGENSINAVYGKIGNKNISSLKTFNIEVDNNLADFEIHIDKYSYSSNELTLEILNIGENDIEALALEIPKQENIKIIGSNKVIVGDLDSNEFTTADFKGELNDGEIEIIVLYTDINDFRREITKHITFDGSYFNSTKEDDSKISIVYIIIILIILMLIIYWFFKKSKKKRGQLRRRGFSKF